MIIGVPQTEGWRGHLEKRLSEACEAGVLRKGDCPVLSSATVFVPTTDDASVYLDMDVEASLRDNFDAQQHIDGRGWIERSDMFEEVALWLRQYCARVGLRVLFCEAGYSRVGDKSLDSRPHVVMGSRPFVHVDLVDSSAPHVATVLRWSRSWRMLGFVAASLDPSRDDRGSLFVMRSNAIRWS